MRYFHKKNVAFFWLMQIFEIMKQTEVVKKKNDSILYSTIQSS